MTKTLKKLVEEYDPGRMFLPTSPSGPSVHFKEHKVGKMLHHDIHGMWKYEGVEYHYKKYNMMDCLFHSEFGADGFSNTRTIRKVIGEKNLLPASGTNMIWRHLGAAWWDTDERDEMIFGPRRSLEQAVKCSQFIQAEALRYIIESHRRRKSVCSGCIPWQFNEPWPNATCTNAVDYYGNPKMAYYWVASSYEKVHASLRYDKLYYGAGEEFSGKVYLDSSFKLKSVSVKYEIMDIRGRMLKYGEYNTVIDRERAVHLGDIEWRVDETEKGIFFVRLTTGYGSDDKSENLYVFSQREKWPFNILPTFGDTALSTKISAETDGETRISIKNTGEVAALFVNVYFDNVLEGIMFDKNFITIFPHEEKTLKITGIKNGRDIFNKDSNLVLDYFNSKGESYIIRHGIRIMPDNSEHDERMQ